jgi:hypothetical protein
VRDHRYPLPDVGFDQRFTAGLLFDLCGLLEAHGYPRPVGGADLIRWQQALFRTIYRTDPEGSTLI